MGEIEPPILRPASPNCQRAEIARIAGDRGIVGGSVGASVAAGGCRPEHVIFLGLHGEFHHRESSPTGVGGFDPAGAND